MVGSYMSFHIVSGFLFKVAHISINFISAATTQHPPARIQNDVLVEVPHDVKKFLPPTKLMKRKIQHARRQQKGPMDENIDDLEVPNLELPDGSLFNLFDNKKPGDRMIILGSKRGLKIVSRSKILLTDGTFKSAPKSIKEKWYQVFVIHAQFMETGEIYPSLFCLMQHRKRENYVELYSELKKMIFEKGWDFEVMKPGGKMYMDMELANKNACKECLNDPEVCVCYFHLCGITNKCIVDIGLRKLVFTSPIFNHHCRMINALATVPLKYVQKAFEKLQSHFETIKSSTLPILEYWEKGLVKGYIVEETRTRIPPKWKPEEWNIYEKIIKKEETSTCKLEGWHNKLDKILMKPHPSFQEFCQVLMGEWVRIDFELDHLASGYTRDDLKFKACTQEEKRNLRIYNVAVSVNDFHSIIDYLDAMAIASKK